MRNQITAKVNPDGSIVYCTPYGYRADCGVPILGFEGDEGTEITVDCSQTDFSGWDMKAKVEANGLPATSVNIGSGSLATFTIPSGYMVCGKLLIQIEATRGDKVNHSAVLMFYVMPSITIEDSVAFADSLPAITRHFEMDGSDIVPIDGQDLDCGVDGEHQNLKLSVLLTEDWAPLGCLIECMNTTTGKEDIGGKRVGNILTYLVHGDLMTNGALKFHIRATDGTAIRKSRDFTRLRIESSFDVQSSIPPLSPSLYDVIMGELGTLQGQFATLQEQLDSGYYNQYVHFGYSESPDGQAFLHYPTSTSIYLGVYSGNSSTAPEDKESYQWMKFKGDKGDKGDTGPQGIQGPVGPTGPAGADGTDGADGVSPSVVPVVENGNTYIEITDADGTRRTGQLNMPQMYKFNDEGPSESIITLFLYAGNPDPAELVGKIIGVTSARRQETDTAVTMHVTKTGTGGLAVPLTLFDRGGNETTTMRAGQRAEGQLMLIYIASETTAYYLNPIDIGYTVNESDQLYANALTGFASGRMVSLTDVAPRAALSECTIQGQTTETGEGDKGPDNPYTITGVTPTKLTVCGKNLFDPVGQFDGLYAYADTYTGSVDVHPVKETYLGRDAVKCQARTLAQTASNVYYFLRDCFEPNTQYTFSFDWAYDKQIPDAPTNTGYYFRIEYTDGSYLMPMLGNASQTVEWRRKTVTSGAGKTIKNVNFSWGSSSIVIYLDFNTFQMERGAAETAYAPYVGAEYPVSPSGAMHCLPNGTKFDTLDVVTGEKIKRLTVKIFDGTENWGAAGSVTGGHGFKYTMSDGKSAIGNVWCSHFQKRPSAIPQVVNTYFCDNPYYGANQFHINITDTLATTVDELKTWLAAQHTAGTPLTVVYELATPVTTQGTGKRIVPPAPEATIYPDAGNVSVGYNRDINIALQMLSNAVTVTQTDNINTEINE